MIWFFSFNSNNLTLCTPWFFISLHDGAKSVWKNTIVWGFDIGWSRNRVAKEGDKIFLKEKSWIFREIGFYQIRCSKSLNSAYEQGIL